MIHLLHLCQLAIILLSLSLGLCLASSSPSEHDSHEHQANRRVLGSAEKRLTKRLLQRYAEWGVVGRPVINSSQVLTVRLGLALIQILDLEENQQRLRTNCWLRFYWRDSLLAWKDWPDAEFQDIQQIRVRPSQIWTPDIKLYNFADERMREKREARVVVENDGQILWIPQALLKSTCKVKILNFPFDTQHCRMKFGSWTYDESQLMLDWSVTQLRINESHTVEKLMPFVDYSDYVKSNEWVTDGEFEVDIADPDQRLMQIRSVVTYRNETGYDSRGNPVLKRHRILEFRIRMMRNPSFYVAILVVPCILLSMLMLVIFWLPPESPAKILLGMNIFVGFFILLLLLAEQIPSAVEAFPLIGCYYCVNMGMITVSTVMAALIVNLHFHGDKSGPVPPILKRVLIDGVGRLLLVTSSPPAPSQQQLQQNQDESSAAHRHSRSFSRENSAESRGSDSIVVQNPRHQHPRFRRQQQQQQQQVRELERTSSSGSGRRAVCEFKNRGGGVSGVAVSSCLLLTCPPEVDSDLREISRFIRLLVGRKKEADVKGLLATEWRTVAQVLDRMFFLLYVILLSSFLLLFIPRRQENVQTMPED